MPRRTKLTPETQRILLEAFSVGTPVVHACRYAGIHVDSYYYWLERGAKGEKLYSEFSEEIQKAQGRAVVGWLAKIEKAASEGNWQAAAWKLERRYPEEFGRTIQEHEVSGKGGKPLEIQVVYGEN